jgi:hypothetical protein
MKLIVMLAAQRDCKVIAILHGGSPLVPDDP